MRVLPCIVFVLLPSLLGAEGGVMDQGRHVLTLTCLADPTIPPAGSRGIYCDSGDGRLHSVSSGGTHVDLEATGGGGSTPTGTGFRHVTGGVEDGAAATLTDADVPNTVTLDNLTQVTTRAISDTTGTLPTSRGGTEVTAAADDQTLVGNGTVWQSKAIPSCSGANQAVTYNTSTNTFGCVTISGGSGPTTVKLSVDRTSTATALADATGLSFAVAASTDYDFSCRLIYRSAATTTGIALAMNGPASPTAFVMQRRIAISLTAVTVGSARAYNSGAASASVDSANNDLLAVLEGTLRNGANAGTLIVRFATEIAASQVTIRAGSYCTLSTIP